MKVGKERGRGDGEWEKGRRGVCKFSSYIKDWNPAMVLGGGGEGMDEGEGDG